MHVAEYVVDTLIEYGVTDTFGIPGCVILKLLYAMEDKSPIITPHLNYHEQMAGFAACGYSQASGKLGVAYATRGPGFTNMVTCIAEAYQESLPVLFITAHGQRPDRGLRFENNQELDAVSMVSGITKYAANIDLASDVPKLLREACEEALGGRRGPVFLDFNSSLWDKDVVLEILDEKPEDRLVQNIDEIVDEISKAILIAKRPVILIGDGIRHTVRKDELYRIAERLGIPVLSSRGSQDLLSGSPFYFGYIGSHGTRYSNFILSKTDLIISIGNRLAFPVNSESFAPVMRNARLIRIDIDEKEFKRAIPGAVNFRADGREVLEALGSIEIESGMDADWIEICNELRSALNECDVTEPVRQLCEYLQKQSAWEVFVCDIGNNEYWFARAFEKRRKKGTVLYSKAYGTLGAGLGRAIGAYYALRRPVCCVIGDQGFQYNIQELAYIRQWKLPIRVLILNNSISGMITDHEKIIFGERLLHVNKDNGYCTPEFGKIVGGYGVPFHRGNELFTDSDEASVAEILIDSAVELTPTLPKGRACQDMEPRIKQWLFEKLDRL